MNVYTDPAMEGFGYSGVHAYEAHGDDPPFELSISKGSVSSGAAPRAMQRQTVYCMRVTLGDRHLAAIYVGDLATVAEVTTRLQVCSHKAMLEFALRFVPPMLVAAHAYRRGLADGVDQQRARVMSALGLSDTTGQKDT